MWLVEQLDDGRDAVVDAHCVLRELGVLVAAGEVAQGAGGRLGYVLFISGTQERVDQSLHAVVLAYKRLVPSVIAGQIRQGARDAGEHVHVICGEEADQNLQQPLQAVLQAEAHTDGFKFRDGVYIDEKTCHLFT